MVAPGTSPVFQINNRKHLCSHISIWKLPQQSGKSKEVELACNDKNLGAPCGLNLQQNNSEIKATADNEIEVFYTNKYLLLKGLCQCTPSPIGNFPQESLSCLWIETHLFIYFWSVCHLFISRYNILGITSSTMLERSSESKHPYLVPDLGRKAFCLLLLNLILAVDIL